MGPLLRVLLKANNITEVPEPPKNLLAVFSVGHGAEKTPDQVLYELEPDRPYDWAVDGL